MQNYLQQPRHGNNLSIPSTDKENVIHIYNGILHSHKKKEILPVSTWMDPEGIMLSEISQTEKDKYHMISLISGI